MAECVKHAGDHLPERNRHGVHRVEHGEIVMRAHHTALDLFLLMGNDCAVVHFAAGAGGGHHRAHGDKRRRIFPLLVFQLPNITVYHRLGRHDLAAVDHAASAYGQDEVHMVLPRQPRPLLNLGVGGVGHDAAKLYYCLARLGKNGNHLVIDPALFQRAAAIGQHHRGAVAAQQACQILLDAALSEVDL